MLELDLHLLAQLQVERAERLVEQQHLRPVDERAGQRDPLSLAAGSWPGFGLEPPSRTISSASLRADAILFAHRQRSESVFHVLPTVMCGKQRVVLETVFTSRS